MATNEELETRLAALEQRLAVVPLAANPPVTIGELTNVPAPGSPIASQWAQDVSSRVLQRFANQAAVAGWAAPNGAIAVAVDTGREYLRIAGGWREAPTGLVIAWRQVIVNGGSFAAETNINELQISGLVIPGLQNRLIAVVASLAMFKAGGTEGGPVTSRVKWNGVLFGSCVMAHGINKAAQHGIVGVTNLAPGAGTLTFTVQAGDGTAGLTALAHSTFAVLDLAHNLAAA